MVNGLCCFGDRTRESEDQPAALVPNNDVDRVSQRNKLATYRIQMDQETGQAQNLHSEQDNDSDDDTTSAIPPVAEERENRVPTVDITRNTLPGEEYRRWDDHPVRKDYDILSSLGRGAFAEVVLGRNKTSGKRAALKIVFLNKPGLKEKHIAILQREGNYLMKLAHKNIVKCTKIYRAPMQWAFVMEHLKGGMLLNDLAKLKRYSEKVASTVFKQLLLAVEYLHDTHIVHRDIKPENVVFKGSSNGQRAGTQSVVKLVDFGMVLDLRKEPTARGMMGSPGFVAPEVILGAYHTTQMDMYSLGVLLFVMLVGAKPMTQDQAKSMQYAVLPLDNLRGVHDPRWRSLTDSAKDLIKHLLALEPKNRYTAKMALNHPWIKGARDDSVLDGSVMESWHDPMQNLPHAAFMGSPYANAHLQQMSPHLAGGHINGIISPHGHRQHSPQVSRSNHHPHNMTSNPMAAMPGNMPHSSPIHANMTSPHGMSNQSPFDPRVNWQQNGYHAHTGELPATSQSHTQQSPNGYSNYQQQWQSHPSDNNLSGPLPGLSGPLPPTYASTQASPLSMHQKAAHDEAIKKAQEAQAQLNHYLLAAQAIRSNASPHQNYPAQGHLSSTPKSAKMSNNMNANETESWHLRHSESQTQSALAVSYASTTQATSTSAALQEGQVPPQGIASRGSGYDESTKKIMHDAQNLMRELNQAPSIAANGDFQESVDMITRSHSHSGPPTEPRSHIPRNSLGRSNPPQLPLAAPSPRNKEAAMRRSYSSGRMQPPEESNHPSRHSLAPPKAVSQNSDSALKTGSSVTGAHDSAGDAGGHVLSGHNSMQSMDQSGSHRSRIEGPDEAPLTSRRASARRRSHTSSVGGGGSHPNVAILTRHFSKDPGREAYYADSNAAAVHAVARTRVASGSGLSEKAMLREKSVTSQRGSSRSHRVPAQG